MWILWNILTGITIASVATIIKKYGFDPSKSYIMYMCLVSISYGWMLPYSYRISPNFIHPFFIQNVVINTLGVIFGKIIFHDVILIQGWIGITMMIIGLFLLIK